MANEQQAIFSHQCYELQEGWNNEHLGPEEGEEDEEIGNKK